MEEQEEEEDEEDEEKRINGCKLLNNKNITIATF